MTAELALLPNWELLLALAAAAFLASTIAGIAGFGASAIMLPLLVSAYGPRDAILILTIIQLVANVSRVWLNRREVVPAVVGWFSVGAVPLAVVGGLAFATAPLSVLTRLLGVLLLGMVIWRHLPRTPQPRISLRGFALLGAVSSFLSALLGTIGPLLVPFFLAYGLVKGAFIGTEALSTVVIQVAKAGVYTGTAVMTPLAAAVGVALTPLMVSGSILGRFVVDRLPKHVFVVIVEMTMVIAGLTFIAGGS